MTYVTLTTSVKRRTEAIGILGVGGFLGFLFGPFLGDLILDREVRTEQQFAVLFVVTSAALIVPPHDRDQLQLTWDGKQLLYMSAPQI